MNTTTNLYQSIKNFIIRNRRIVVILIHLIQAVLANYLAFVLRFEAIINPAYFRLFLRFLPVLVIIRLFFYIQTKLYKDLWRYSSIGDLIKILKSVSLGSIIFLIVVRYLFGDTQYPRSIYVLDWLLLIMLSGGSRLLVRVFREYLQSEHSGKKTLIIGAGDAGSMIVREMKNNPKYGYEPIGFIDDDPYKKGLSMHGVTIFGPKNMLVEVIEKYRPEEILVAIPSANHKTINEIYEICKHFKIPIKTIPAMSDIIDGTVTVSQIRPLSLEDLLQREQVKTDIEEVRKFIEGKRVLVTGAGGSIGSELCRQIIEYKPYSMIMLDRYENGLFEIDRELQAKSKELTNGQADKQIVTVVGDMRDTGMLESVFSVNKPQIVFHAAAHKHVPLMEHNPLEAVKNNIFGTRNLIDAATKYKAENFVMISTDKAVNPTNIMGATKRVAEFLTMTTNSLSETKFTTVRFGNVLGSNGSVVHIFKEQLKQGGPLTVTHPEIKRFFMLIPEAVQLVLVSASSGKGGEIFVLDMGEQIKIVDLAENLIRLSGFIPYEDIRIEFTGLRPGEKLFEELFDTSENMILTDHEKLRVAVPSEVPSHEELSSHFAVLEGIIGRNAIEEIIPALRKIVPNFNSES